MSNNSGVTEEGLEMGRAQIVQAVGARVEPHVDMNPVLLKPASENGSQVILLGKVLGHQDAQSYFRGASSLGQKAYEALDRLRAKYECIVIEGAGSCAEVNLRAREYVNFPCAHHADSKVILVADIDRGGVFAQVIGSLEVMPPEDRARVSGIIINRFRGDRSLFDDGVEFIEKRTGLPVLGVVPYLMGLAVESEDSLQMQAQLDPPQDWGSQKRPEELRIAVLRLPHISNSTDFDSLMGIENVSLHFLYQPRDLSSYDLVLLPGTKNVRHDLSWLREVGWVQHLNKAQEAGQNIAGICGGYQMMGEALEDPDGVEGAPGSQEGLAYLPTRTRLQTEKKLSQVEGRFTHLGTSVFGYEIHMGETETLRDAPGFAPALALRDRVSEGPYQEEGVRSEDGKIWGSYVHGLFDSPSFLAALLSEIRPDQAEDWEKRVRCPNENRELQIERFTESLRENLDVEKLLEIAGIKEK